MPHSDQMDMFKIQTEAGAVPQKVVLHVQGIVPSFKTQKTAYGWIDKASGKVFARPATLPEHRKWMQRTVLSFELQLRSAFQITKSETLTDAILHSLIASLPHDDCWSAVRETFLKSELCEPGQEGATIVIERIQ